MPYTLSATTPPSTCRTASSIPASSAPAIPPARAATAAPASPTAVAPADETAPERVLRLTGVDVGLCPACKAGRLAFVRNLPRIRAGPAA